MFHFCLFVRSLHYFKNYEQILTGGRGPWTNRLDLGSHPDHDADPGILDPDLAPGLVNPDHHHPDPGIIIFLIVLKDSLFSAAIPIVSQK